mgnify:FL=1
MRYVLVMLGSLVGLVIVAYLLLYLLISVGCICLLYTSPTPRDA